MNDVEVVRDAWAQDDYRTRMVVKIGEQHFLISRSTWYEPEVAICRVPPDDDPDWDPGEEFWARTGGSIEDAVAALRAMTPEQLVSPEVDRPDYDAVALGSLLDIADDIRRGRA